MTEKNEMKALKNKGLNLHKMNTKDAKSIHNKDIVPKKYFNSFETSDALLNEINCRYRILNQNTIILKKLPKELTTTTLKQIIPEMLSCRLPKSKENFNKGYAFVQLKNEELVEKYLNFFKNNKIENHIIGASKVKPLKKFTNLNDFDLKTLYFNFLKQNMKLSDIKDAFPNTQVLMTKKDKMARYSVTVTFINEEAAHEVFVANDIKINGVKLELKYLIKDDIINNEKQNIDNRFSFDRPDEILNEIKSRFASLKGRNIIIKNPDNHLSLVALRQMLPAMRNCRLSADKRLCFVDFVSAEDALKALTLINGQMFNGRILKAFVAKVANIDGDLSLFDLSSLHVSNLRPETSASDIEKVFVGCSVDMPLNDDGTSMGYCTVTFGSEDEALRQFEKVGIEVGGVAVDINFKMSLKRHKKRRVESVGEVEPKKAKI